MDKAEEYAARCPYNLTVYSMNTNTLEEPSSLPSTHAAPPPHPLGGEAGPFVQGTPSFPEGEAAKDSPVRQLKETGAHTMHAAKEAGAGFLAAQKEKIASCIDEYSGGLRHAGESLKNEDKISLAVPAEKTAARLQSTANYLRNKEPADMFHDLEDFARRRPEVVYGTLFIAGLAAVRFLKASAKNPRSA